MDNSEDPIIAQINHALSSLKYKYEREDALQQLENVPMTLDRLLATEAGRKITQMFRSSRFAERAAALHERWLQTVDVELQKRWPEIKRMYFTGPQIRELERLQHKFEREHPELVVPLVDDVPKLPGPASDNRRTSGFDDLLPSAGTSSVSSRPLHLRYLDGSPLGSFDDRRTPDVYDDGHWNSGLTLGRPSSAIDDELDEEMMEYMDEDEIEEFRIKAMNDRPPKKRGRPRKSTAVGPMNEGVRSVSIFDRTGDKPTRTDPDFKPGYYYVKRGRGRGRGIKK